MNTYEQIAKRAYELWERSGKSDGHDLEHWLQAENDARQEVPQKTPRAQKASTTSAPMLKMPKARKFIGR